MKRCPKCGYDFRDYDPESVSQYCVAAVCHYGKNKEAEEAAVKAAERIIEAVTENWIRWCEACRCFVRNPYRCASCDR